MAYFRRRNYGRRRYGGYRRRFYGGFRRRRYGGFRRRGRGGYRRRNYGGYRRRGRGGNQARFKIDGCGYSFNIPKHVLKTYNRWATMIIKHTVITEKHGEMYPREIYQETKKGLVQDMVQANVYDAYVLHKQAENIGFVNNFINGHKHHSGLPNHGTNPINATKPLKKQNTAAQQVKNQVKQGMKKLGKRYAHEGLTLAQEALGLSTGIYI